MSRLFAGLLGGNTSEEGLMLHSRQVGLKSVEIWLTNFGRRISLRSQPITISFRCGLALVHS